MSERASGDGREWEGLARRTAVKIQWARMLDTFLPLLAGSSVLAFLGLLFFKSRGDAGLAAWAGWAAAAAASAGLSWWSARRSPCTPAEALLRLDVAMALKNRLVAAAAGAGAWPPVPPEAHDGLGWRWRRLLAPLAASCGLVAAGVMVPVTVRARPLPLPSQEPLAWEDMAEDLSALQEEDFLEEEALKDAAARLDALKNQPQEEWYRHHSLEATDAMAAQLGEEIRRLERNLEQMEGALEAAERAGAALGEAQARQLQEQWNKAFEGVEGGQLRMKAEWMKQLRQMDLSKLKNIPAADLAALQKKLERAGEACRECGGKDGEGERDGPGRGGVDRGPGTAPLALEGRERPVNSQRVEQIVSPEAEPELGDVTESGLGAPEADRSGASTGGAGGGVRDPGRGGDPVSRLPVTPEERKVLRKFFK